MKASWPVWGHQTAVATLSRAVATDRVRHAYLISGPDGVGKHTLALAFSKALNCLQPPRAGEACGVCRSCMKIDRGVHPDIQRVDLDSQIAAATKSTGKNTTLTIETIRGMIATAALRPMEGRWRVTLVDDAEAMQETAQEALLKTLEEPPPFAVIILLCDDLELLLPTIRSRCQAIELAAVPRSVVADGLRSRGVDEAKIEELSGAAAGSPGWALRALANPKLLTERAEALDRAVGWVAATPFERVVTAFKMGDSFSKRRPATFHELEKVLGVWRDLLLLKTDLPRAVTFPTIASDLAPYADRWPLTGIHAALRSVRQCIADLEANIRPRLAIESMVLQWPTP